MNKKQQDIAIKVAIIGAIGVIVAGYLQSPLANTQWEKRPIIDVTFGDGLNYPKQSLQLDKDGYAYVDILMRNRGQSDGKVTVMFIAENAFVNFDKNQDFSISDTLDYNIIPNKNYTLSRTPLYVKPNENIQQFSITLSIQNVVSPPAFQEINLMKPVKLVFTKSDEEYIISGQE